MLSTDMYQKKVVYDRDGNQLVRGDIQDVLTYIRSRKACLVSESFDELDLADDLLDFVNYEGAKVNADRKGRPHSVRLQAGNSSRWIVDCGSWYEDKGISPERIGEIEDWYQFYGVGYKPTPASTGSMLSRVVWQKYGLQRYYAPSLACETFIRDNNCGGIVQTPGKGKEFEELMLLDMSSAWVSMYVLHPCGTAVPIFEGDSLDTFFTYFVRCNVYVPRTLPLGPFPYRSGNSTGKRVYYPTEEGVYRDAYLWKEQINDCVRAGCFVSIIDGYGWHSYTTDNYYWAEESYVLRTKAPSGPSKQFCKRAAVGAIGGQLSPREHYTLVGEGDAGDGDCPVIIGHNAVNIYLHTERNDRDPYMVHWVAYTVAMCNSYVYNFALPYAREGRLVAINYDSILIVERDERHSFVARKDVDGLDLPPGTWLYMLLHDVRDIKDRSFKSKEMNKTPGEPSLV